VKDGPDYAQKERGCFVYADKPDGPATEVILLPKTNYDDTREKIAQLWSEIICD
jgi:hypothetical protein